MSDEDRRALEREARYSSALAAFLACLREGHEPRTWMPHGQPERKVSVQGLWVCKRCRLTYCPPDTGAEREGLPVEIRPMQAILVSSTPVRVDASESLGRGRVARERAADLRHLAS